MDTNISLADLAKNLRAVKNRKLATQMSISKVTSIDQATISRALNERCRRMTPSLIRLYKYVNMLLGDKELSSEVQQAAKNFLVHGGTEKELIASIEHSSRLVQRQLSLVMQTTRDESLSSDSPHAQKRTEDNQKI